MSIFKIIKCIYITKKIYCHNIEKIFLEKLENERRKNYGEMINTFTNANIPQEELMNAQKHQEFLEKKFGKMNKKNFHLFENNIFDLGKKID